MSLPIRSLVDNNQEAGPSNQHDTLSDASTQPDPNDRASFATPSGQQSSPPSVYTPSSKKAKVVPDSQSLVSAPQHSPLYNRQLSTSADHVLFTPNLRGDGGAHVGGAPPSPEADVAQFNIFNALLKYPELTIEMTKYLSIQELLDLYAISRDFHYVVNQRFTTMIHNQAFARAPESAKVFPHRCYRNLCMLDPARRELGFSVPKRHRKVDENGQAVPHPRDTEIRLVPSFRWLKMVIFREYVVDDILYSMAIEGIRLPREGRVTLKKLWFMMDVGDSKTRMGLMHNQEFWTHTDLFVATMFFLKLEMYLTDPTHGTGYTQTMRSMLVNQRSLSTLARIMRRKEMKTPMQVFRMLLRFSHDYPPPPDGHFLLGIPPYELGQMTREGWGTRPGQLVQIDRLIMGEGIRRSLNLPFYYIDMILYGFIDKHTFEDIRAPPPIYDLSSSEEESSDDNSDGQDQRSTHSEGRRVEEGVVIFGAPINFRRLGPQAYNRSIPIIP